MIGIPLAPRSLADLVARHGGEVRHGAVGTVRRLVPVFLAAAGDLAPVYASRFVDEALAAQARGATLLVDEALLAANGELSRVPAWVHPHAVFTLAELLDLADAPASEPSLGVDCRIGPGAVLLPRVKLGSRVIIGAGAVVGAPGFGFATGPFGKTRAVPHVGGVVIEDDVHIGPLATIAAGTLVPTVIRSGAKLDAQVHVGHNCEIGEGSIVAAQCGLAGSVHVGRGVMIGGQVGIADHVVIGDGARIAAKSGVIGDVEAGTTVGGYPAVERLRWLRGLAELYRLASQSSVRGARSAQGSHGNGASVPPPASGERR